MRLLRRTADSSDVQPPARAEALARCGGCSGTDKCVSAVANVLHIGSPAAQCAAARTLSILAKSCACAPAMFVCCLL